jgi:predicted transcriptional regulator
VYKLIIAAGLMLPATAFADGLTTDQLVDATKIAIENFNLERPALTNGITGFKTWKSGQDGKVKIYVTSGGQNSEFTYTCHGHDGIFECHGH